MTNTIVAQISGNTALNEATQHLIELAARSEGAWPPELQTACNINSLFDTSSTCAHLWRSA